MLIEKKREREGKRWIYKQKESGYTRSFDTIVPVSIIGIKEMSSK